MMKSLIAARSRKVVRFGVIVVLHEAFLVAISLWAFDGEFEEDLRGWAMN
jgi:hypothetical protein